jgi:hypothetical protein
MNAVRLLAVAAAVAASLPARAAAPAICETLLPVSALERISSVKPLRVAGNGEVKYGGGTCNYAKGDVMVLLLTVDDGARWEQQYKRTYKGATPVAGVGDEAFKVADSLYFKKGNKVVGIGRFMDLSTFKKFVDDVNLMTLAKQIAAKM